MDLLNYRVACRIDSASVSDMLLQIYLLHIRDHHL